MSLGQDVRFALRSLRKSPVFTAVAVLSLALGIGANTAIFSIIDQTLMRALPVANAGELALVHRKGGNSGRVLGDNRFSYPIYRDFRDRNQVFSGLIAWYQDGVALSSGGQSEVVSAVLVSGNYFQVLGAGAFLGRTFTADDDRTPGAHPVVMLGYGFWKRRFAGDPEILNRKIALNGRPMTVVGVTAPAFTGTDATEAPDLFVPLMMKAQMTPTWDDMENRRSLWLNLMGRLKPGVSRSQAEAALNTILRPIAEMEYRDTIPVHNDYSRKRFLAQRILLVPGAKGNQNTPEEVTTALTALMAMVGVVLLIACANVANLMLARAAAREREVAVRLALGARRGHIARQLLAESLLLAGAGGVAGLIVGVWTTSTILGLIPSDYGASALTAEPNARMLLFTLAVSVLTGFLFGLAPAWKASRPDVAASLKDQGTGISAAGRHVRLRKTLVTAQVALSLVLLAAAGLFARTLYNLKGVNPGFRTENLITFALDPSLSGYLGPRATAFYERLQGTLAAVPGVRAVSMSHEALLSGNRSLCTVTVEGYRRKDGEDMNPDQLWIGPGFFETMGIPLAAGRDFSARDGLGAPRVAIINSTMARYFFGNDNPLGRRIGLGHEQPGIEIVGVVGDTKISDLREKPRRAFYLPYMQDKEVGGLHVYVRTAADPGAMAAVLRREVRNLDSAIPVIGLRSMRVQIDRLLLLERIVAGLSLAFGLLATLLAAVGLYGVMAYTVVRRTREIGIRVALGATRNTVLGLVLREAGQLAAIGIAIALPAAYALNTLMRSLLYGLAPADPATLIAATLITAAVVLAASGIPARRATRIDPLTALRYE